jgi:hypothetical protein
MLFEGVVPLLCNVCRSVRRFRKGWGQWYYQPLRCILSEMKKNIKSLSKACVATVTGATDLHLI